MIDIRIQIQELKMRIQDFTQIDYVCVEDQADTLKDIETGLSELKDRLKINPNEVSDKLISLEMAVTKVMHQIDETEKRCVILSSEGRMQIAEMVKALITTISESWVTKGKERFKMRKI